LVNLKYLILESLIVPDGEMEEYDYVNLISICSLETVQPTPNQEHFDSRRYTPVLLMQLTIETNRFYKSNTRTLATCSVTAVMTYIHIASP